jgi:hypothetical protein
MISVLALIVATSAGSAYAATKIGTKQLKNNAVTSAKIKNRTITTSDLATATRTALRGTADGDAVHRLLREPDLHAGQHRQHRPERAVGHRHLRL